MLVLFAAAGPAEARRDRRTRAPRSAPPSETAPRGRLGQNPGANPNAGAPATAEAPFTLPENPYRNSAAEGALDSVRILFADGRAPLNARVNRGPDGPTLSLGDLGRIAGSGFRWDPETWRGSFTIDSTDVAFVLDTPIFWVRSEAIQVPSPVRYVDETVQMPLAVIDGILAPMLGNRCRWDPVTGVLALGGPAPRVDVVALSGAAGAAALTLSPVGDHPLLVRWDPAGVLEVEVKGVHLPPGPVRAEGGATGVEVAGVRPTDDGFLVRLRLDPGWLAVRIRSGRVPESRVVELTSRVTDSERGGFEVLGDYLTPRLPGAAAVTPARKVLIELDPRANEWNGGDCLRTLAEKVRGDLSQQFGDDVTLVVNRSEDSGPRSADGDAEPPPDPPADCWIGLRLQDWPSAGVREFLLVVPGPAPYLMPVTGQGVREAGLGGVPATLPGTASSGSLEGWRMTPYGQAVRPFGRSSAALARSIDDHLGHSWSDRPVEITSRPARIFRGLAMPAVLVYPVVLDDKEGIDALCDPTKSDDLAKNIAFAVDEFLHLQAER